MNATLWKEVARNILTEIGCMTDAPTRNVVCKRKEKKWEEKSSWFIYERLDISEMEMARNEEDEDSLLSAIVTEMEARRREGFYGAIVSYFQPADCLVFEWF